MSDDRNPEYDLNKAADFLREFNSREKMDPLKALNDLICLMPKLFADDQVKLAEDIIDLDAYLRNLKEKYQDLVEDSGGKKR